MIFSKNQLVFYVRHARTLLFGGNVSEFCANGICVLLRSRTIDGYIFNEVFNKQDYLPSRTIDLQGGVFIDLGAQIGLFSVWASKKYHPKTTLCVEPFTNNIAMLKQNLNKHQIQAEVIEKAVYVDNKGALLQRSNLNSGGHAINPHGKNAVNTITMSKLLAKVDHVDYLKIDIEGSEKYVFSDENMNIIAQKVKFIKMEVHPSKNVSLNKIVALLTKKGFDVVIIQNPKRIINVALLEAYRQ